MLPFILAALRTYSPYLMFPIAVTVGTIGYFIESKLRSDTGNEPD